MGKRKEATGKSVKGKGVTKKKAAPGKAVKRKKAAVGKGGEDRKKGLPRGRIPEDRPVVGLDLEQIRQSLNLSVSDACYLFGLSLIRWGEIVNEKGLEPVSNGTLALLARYLDKYPEDCPIRKPVKPGVFLEHVNDALGRKIPVNRLGLLLGRNKTAGNRWLKYGGATSAPVDRLVTLLDDALVAGKLDVEAWAELAMKEAEFRRTGSGDGARRASGADEAKGRARGTGKRKG